MAAEQQFLQAIQDKHSPLFHRYLTVAQWTARFGPSAAAQNAVVSWAQGAGLTVTHLYPNRLIVDLAGSVGSIENALGVQINNYRLGTKTFFANSQDPVLPASLTGVVESVEGLSSLQSMFPAAPTVHEPASPAYVAGPVAASGPYAAGNGSRAKLRAAQRASRGANAGAARGAKVHITSGAYDPTDIYSSQAYDYNALYNQGHCCNPLGNPGSHVRLAAGQRHRRIPQPVPLPGVRLPGVLHRRHPGVLRRRGDHGRGVVHRHVQQLRLVPGHREGVPLRRCQLQRLHVHRHLQQDGLGQPGAGVQH
jgi:hypothetical protein